MKDGKMEFSLCFSDVLLVPKFSSVVSRKDVDPTIRAFQDTFFPIISSNMDTVTSWEMTNAMFNYGGLERPGARGCLHRFWDVQENIDAFKKSATKTWVSFGLGPIELERAKALKDSGANTFVLDVAHGASTEVAKQVKDFRDLVGYYPNLIVGNFATGKSIEDFNNYLGDTSYVNGYKVGIGGGSACTTRLVTGCGLPTLGSLIDCSRASVPLIADGGIRSSGDVAKSLAVPNVKAVFLGGMLAGTQETPGEMTDWSSAKVNNRGETTQVQRYKKYRGSASQESYEVQGKASDWRTAEGESFLVSYKGPVKDVLRSIESGLRSSMSYVGASTLKEFQEKSEFIQISHNGFLEGKAHGKS